jgi:hypothetical protein
MMPNQAFCKTGNVIISSDPKHSLITATFHSFLSIIPFKNFIVNKNYKQFEEKATIVGQFEIIAKWMWERNKGIMEPTGLVKMMAKRLKSPKTAEPSGFIGYILVTLERQLAIYNQGSNETFRKLFANTLIQQFH